MRLKKETWLEYNSKIQPVLYHMQSYYNRIPIDIPSQVILLLVINFMYPIKP